MDQCTFGAVRPLARAAALRRRRGANWATRGRAIAPRHGKRPATGFRSAPGRRWALGRQGSMGPRVGGPDAFCGRARPDRDPSGPSPALSAEWSDEIPPFRFLFAQLALTLGSRPRGPRCGRAAGRGALSSSHLLSNSYRQPLQRNTKCHSKIWPQSAQDPKNLPVEFEFDATLVRTIAKEGQAWFVAKDVCDILGIDNPSQAVGRLEDDEKRYQLVYVRPSVPVKYSR